MAGKPDASNIGQDRSIQDPEKALEQTEGAYHDAVQDVPIEDRLNLNRPMAPDPQPFNLKG